MQILTQLGRSSLCVSVQAAIRQMIVDQVLAEGERINEVHLAKMLGVSRTPLREALAKLQSEGAIEARLHYGYFVKPLCLDEFEQLYDLRPILDPVALRLSGVPNEGALARLKILNSQLEREIDAEAAIHLDDEWHGLLLSGCPNKALIEMIEGVCARTRRYELILARQKPERHRTTGEHQEILDALDCKDLEAACAALERNLRSSKAVISQWLADRTGRK